MVSPMVYKPASEFVLKEGKILFLGATGYIGGSVLAGLLARYPTFRYTCIVRDQGDLKKVEALGVQAHIGSTDDAAFIEQAVSGHDIVINCSDARNLSATSAILAGLGSAGKDKYEPGQRKKIYLHTSCAEDMSFRQPSASDKPSGVTEKYDQPKLDQNGALVPRDVDSIVVEASKWGGLDAYVVVPSTIYGRGCGSVDISSDQTASIIRSAVHEKGVSVPRSGATGAVHIDDLVDLYLGVFARAISGMNLRFGYANMFSTETVVPNCKESSTPGYWDELGAALAKALHARGLVENLEIGSTSSRSAFAPETMALLSECSRELGWKPRRPTFIECLPDEIESALERI